MGEVGHRSHSHTNPQIVINYAPARVVILSCSIWFQGGCSQLGKPTRTGGKLIVCSSPLMKEFFDNSIAYMFKLT